MAPFDLCLCHTLIGLGSVRTSSSSVLSKQLCCRKQICSPAHFVRTSKLIINDRLTRLSTLATWKVLLGRIDCGKVVGFERWKDPFKLAEYHFGVIIFIMGNFPRLFRINRAHFCTSGDAADVASGAVALFHQPRRSFVYDADAVPATRSQRGVGVRSRVAVDAGVGGGAQERRCGGVGVGGVVVIVRFGVAGLVRLRQHGLWFGRRDAGGAARPAAAS